MISPGAMRVRFFYTPLAILVFVLTACGIQSPTSSPGLQSSSTAPSLPVEITPTSTQEINSTLPPPTHPTSTLAPAPPTPEDPPETRTYYQIAATLNYRQHHLAVDQQIIYTNSSTEPLPDLLLIVEPSRYLSTFTLNRISWQDGQPISNYSREIGFLRISLESNLEPGETIGLILSYDLNLPSPSPSYYGRPVPFGYSTRQSNLVDWYPFIPPYQAGQGWVAHQPGAFGEHLVYEAADFDVSIRITDSNPDLKIAASAPGTIDDEWWQYQLYGARNFSWSVSDQYVLSTTTVDSVLVMSYYFPNDAQPGEVVLQTTAEALSLYNDLFGAYPRQTLTVVEADFLDGMEYDGLYFLSKGFYNLYSGKPGDYLVAIAAHETAHQWWYGIVGNDQALDPWLDEALSTYSEKLYYEKEQPTGLDWWWTYRIDYYQPGGWVDGSIYNPQGYRAYRDAVYLNGARFLEDLRLLIGDNAFFAFISSYTQQLKQQISSTEVFFAVLGEYSQENLGPLVDKYFQNPSR